MTSITENVEKAMQRAAIKEIKEVIDFVGYKRRVAEHRNSDLAASYARLSAAIAISALAAAHNGDVDEAMGKVRKVDQYMHSFERFI